jgi:thiol-disulfide isomerase/thioredoxin
MELVFNYIFVWKNLSPPTLILTNLLSIGLTFLFSVLFWYSLKPLLLNAANLKIFKAAYLRLHNNKDVFEGLLIKELKAPDGWQNLGIPFGVKDASNTLIKVCNPFCGPCARAHPKLEQLLEIKDDLNIKIFFKYNPLDEKAPKIVFHLMVILSEGNVDRMKAALHAWYSADVKDYKLFAEKFPINTTSPGFDLVRERILKEMEAIKNWCEAAEVTHTPTYFFNGFKMPENYGIEELLKIL